MASKTGPGLFLKATALTALALTTSAPLAAQKAPAGFTSIFDGKSLKGWTGDSAYFTAKDGVLTAGSTKEIPINTYLILDKPYADFEMRFKYRWATEVGNSGIQFRSGIAEGHYALAGLQANNTPIIARTHRFGMLYEELGDRQEMALLGQKAVITRRAAARGGQGRIVRTVTGTVNPPEAIIKSIKPYPEWNDVVLIAHGNRIVHVINGLVAFDATDNDPLARRDGLIGIQAHSGPPMVVEFRDMAIKPLKSFPAIEGRFTMQPGPAPTPARTYKDSTKVGLEDPALPE